MSPDDEGDDDDDDVGDDDDDDDGDNDDLMDLVKQIRGPTVPGPKVHILQVDNWAPGPNFQGPDCPGPNFTGPNFPGTSTSWLVVTTNIYIFLMPGITCIMWPSMAGRSCSAISSQEKSQNSAGLGCGGRWPSP